MENAQINFNSQIVEVSTEKNAKVVLSFLQKIQDRINSLDLNLEKVLGGDKKQTTLFLDSQLRGFNATAKLLLDFANTANEREMTTKGTFYTYFMLSNIVNGSKEDIKSFICKYLPNRIHNNCICECVYNQDLKRLRAEKKDLIKALNSDRRPSYIDDEAEKAGLQLKAAKAAKDENAIKQAQNLVNSFKDWHKVLTDRIEAKNNEIDILSMDLAKAFESVGFVSWFDNNNDLVGALAPIVRFTPKSLANLIRLAAIEKSHA